MYKIPGDVSGWKTYTNDAKKRILGSLDRLEALFDVRPEEMSYRETQLPGANYA